MKEAKTKNGTFILAAVVAACLATPLVSTAGMSHHGKGYEHDEYMDKSFMDRGEECRWHDYRSRKGEHHEYRGGDRQHRGEHGFKYPNSSVFNNTPLTAEQIKQLDTLRLDFEKKVIPLHAQLKTLKLDLDGFYRAASLDKEKIREISIQIADIRSELYMLKVEHRLNENELLMPKQ